MKDRSTFMVYRLLSFDNVSSLMWENTILEEETKTVAVYDGLMLLPTVELATVKRNKTQLPQTDPQNALPVTPIVYASMNVCTV